jgi:predicted esterase
MKQETLEEAAKEYAKQHALSTRHISHIGFEDGAKWQAERMYSEEEVKQIIDATLIEYSDFVLADVPEWFKQFKKK